MSGIVLEGVTKRYGDETAVEDVDLEVRSGELFVLVGPSGCGKTTLLRVIAGIEAPTEGEVYIDGERVTGLPARKRDVSFVFQDFALFPHMDVRDNLSFNLRMRDGYEDADRRVEDAAERLGIAGLLDRDVEGLSGGQKQRVALGRAIVSEPRAFLLDEPFANLDENLREGMRDEVVRLHDDLDATTIHVTHDQREALSMGDRVAVLRDGAIKQIGEPEAIYRRPGTRFVAQFVGTPRINLLPGRVDAASGAVRIEADDGPPIAFPLEVDRPDGAPVEVGVRPEHLSVDAGASGRPDRPRATVERVEFQGADRFAHLTMGGHDVVARLDGATDVAEGDPAVLDVPPGRLHVFDAEDGHRLPSGSAPGDAERPGRSGTPARDVVEDP